jgi:hypothetical protein
VKQQSYETWGRAAAVPGLQLAIDTLQEFLDELRGPYIPKRRGRPPKDLTTIEDAPNAKGRQSGKWQWRNPDGTLMDKEQRSAEMKRRLSVKRGEQPAIGRRSRVVQPKKGTPEYHQKMSEAQKERWARMTQAARREVSSKISAARKANGAA